MAGRNAGSLTGWARGSTAGRGQTQSRAILVGAQVALAFVLLAGAGLLTRSFIRLTAQPIGFDSGQVLTAELSLPPLGYDTEEKRRHIFSTLIERIADHPGVTAATASTALPFTWWESSDSFRILDRGAAAPARVPYRVLAPGYLDTLHIPLLSGRDFSNTDTPSSPRVALVNEQFAIKYAKRSGHATHHDRRRRRKHAAPLVRTACTGRAVSAARAVGPIDDDGCRARTGEPGGRSGTAARRAQ
jgi:hypothetical protein